MSLDVYFRRDITNIITGQIVATLQQADGSNYDFVRGKLSALQAVALSVGADFGELAAAARENVDAVGLLQDAPQAVIGAGSVGNE